MTVYVKYVVLKKKIDILHISSVLRLKTLSVPTGYWNISSEQDKVIDIKVAKNFWENVKENESCQFACVAAMSAAARAHLRITIIVNEL